MPRPALFATLLGALCALAGCDGRDAAASLLARLGHPSFREVDAPQARAWLERDGALLLQARGEGYPLHRLAGAALVAPGEPLAEAPADRRIVVVAEEAGLGLRLGATLARAGGTRVAVVSGGLPAWGPNAKEE